MAAASMLAAAAAVLRQRGCMSLGMITSAFVCHRHGGGSLRGVPPPSLPRVRGPSRAVAALARRRALASLHAFRYIDCHTRSPSKLGERGNSKGQFRLCSGNRTQSEFYSAPQGRPSLTLTIRTDSTVPLNRQRPVRSWLVAEERRGAGGGGAARCV